MKIDIRDVKEARGLKEVDEVNNDGDNVTIMMEKGEGRFEGFIDLHENLMEGAIIGSEDNNIS